MRINERLVHVWWWISVPYSLLMVSLLLFSESNGAYLIHSYIVVGLLYWALLRCSVLWTAIAAVTLWKRSIRRTLQNTTMFILGLMVTVIAGLEFVIGVING